MTYTGAEAIRQFIGTRFAEQLAGMGIDPARVPDDFDLMERGIIDSLGLIELIADVDSTFGIAVDFEEMDPEQLTVIGPFCVYVADRGGL